MSAYQTVADALQAVMPAGWKFVAYEPTEGSPDALPDVTSVTMRVRSVSRLPAAPIGAYQLDWLVTVTSPYPSRETADPQLFDDLVDFLGAIDSIGIGTAEPSSWLAWTEATKTVGEDLQRLAYDITVRTHTQKEA